MWMKFLPNTEFEFGRLSRYHDVGEHNSKPRKRGKHENPTCLNRSGETKEDYECVQKESNMLKRLGLATGDV
jgi:hypothetical protein